MIERARAVGVHGFMVIGVGSDTKAAEGAVAVAREFPGLVYASVGCHPHDAKTYASQSSALLELAGAKEVVAIGEAGLDYHYDSSPRPVQREVFAAHIALARQLRKPLVVHTREAAADTLEIMRSENAAEIGGIIHCFSEDVAFAKAALDLGFDLSFSGIVTFKNAVSIQEAAVFAPADRILVETDSPYLAPVPKRGKPCEPAYVSYTARRVAELRGSSFEELARQTTENAERRLGVRFEAA
ncbi:MAG: TatD family hydrolase [Polyangiaceae bacterium]